MSHRRPFLASLFLEPSDDTDTPNHWRFQCLELGLESIGCALGDTMHYGLQKVRERLAEVVEQGTDLDRLRAKQEDWDHALEVSRSSKPHGYLRVPFEWPEKKEVSEDVPSQEVCPPFINEALRVAYSSAGQKIADNSNISARIADECLGLDYKEPPGLLDFFKLPCQPRRVLFEGNDPFIVAEFAAGPTGEERCLEREKSFVQNRRPSFSQLGRELFPIQPMPPAALAYLAFEERAQETSDKSEVLISGRSLRENLDREIDDFVLRKLEEAVKPAKPARTVTRFPCMVLPDRFGDIIVVRYPKGERVEGLSSESYTGWDKGSAWDDLVHHNPIEGVSEGDNPWRKDHTDTHWGWRCEP